MILVGDIGGTKTVLSLYEAAEDGVRGLHEEVYASREHASLDEILERFLERKDRSLLRCACFGVAGAVLDGRVRTTNLPWTLEEEELARVIGVRSVKLLNDLEAAAYGMLFLPERDLVTLNPGRAAGRRGNIAVIAAGTGLGEAILYWDGSTHHPLATEGGHADLAPRNEREIDLLRFLQRELDGRVSIERVVSGPGLFNVYRFVRETSGVGEPDWLAKRIREDDPSAAVSEAGLAGEDEVCAETLRLFSSMYGAEAGNMALRCMALGGVFIGGGIAPKILPALQDGSFLQAFADKGRFSELVRGIEVYISRNLRAPLIGCAHYALRLERA